ncbi:hypothetical protein AB1283_17350 [Bacillus sp. S13(2024)]
MKKYILNLFFACIVILFPLHTLADTMGGQSAKTISPNNGMAQKQGWIEE